MEFPSSWDHGGVGASVLWILFSFHILLACWHFGLEQGGWVGGTGNGAGLFGGDCQEHAPAAFSTGSIVVKVTDLFGS